jgi:hypothetical protein
MSSFITRVNFPCCVARKMASPVFRLIFQRIPDVEKGFDRRINDVQLLSRTNVKGKSRTRPTENRFASLTPLRFRRYFSNDDSRFIASRILKVNT